jgi:glycerol uptake facilitator-like aquaporin
MERYGGQNVGWKKLGAFSLLFCQSANKMPPQRACFLSRNRISRGVAEKYKFKKQKGFSFHAPRLLACARQSLFPLTSEFNFMRTILRKLFAEALGTALLLSIVVGSGIMAERLAVGNVGVALLGNTLATVWGLFFLINTFGTVSGAHFNPLVSIVMAFQGQLAWKLVVPYIIMQFTGAICGTWLTHLMFELPVLQSSLKIRTGGGQWVAEIIATAGLLLVILRAPKAQVAALVAAYIGAAYWFTASTSFANPAAAFGRMFTDTFAGIAPTCVPGFIAAQCTGAIIGVVVHHLLGDEERVSS